MNALRIVFMGTPDIAVPTLQALHTAKHNIVGVFCQPDKEKGRGKKVQMPPVKEAALALGLPVYQPVSLRTDEAQALLEELAPDLVIVIAYGKILPSWLIHQPRYGCINLHASILPKYRGAAPVQYAIWQGDTITGMTIMQMDEGLDTGDILEVREISVTELMTSAELFDALAELGGAMIPHTIDKLVAGELSPIPQNNEHATHTGKITKEMGLIDWTGEAHEIACRIRAFNASPGCFTFLQGKRIKLWLAVEDMDSPYSRGKGGTMMCMYPQPGAVVSVQDNSFSVITGRGVVRVLEVQPENKKRMSAGDFIRGHQIKVGTYFGV